MVSAKDMGGETSLGGGKRRRWIVGNGDNEKIQDVSWLRNMEKIMFKSENCTMGDDAKVEELIDMHIGNWNMTLIYNPFN